MRELGGTLVSEYRGNAALLMRIEADGDAIRGILDLTEVAAIDRPPIPDLPADDLGLIGIEDIGEIDPPTGETVVIGIVDSGVTSAHPLLQPAIVSTFGEPADLSDSGAPRALRKVGLGSVRGEPRARLVDTSEW